MFRIKTLVIVVTLFIVHNTACAQAEAIFYILNGLRFLPDSSGPANNPNIIQPKLGELIITDLNSLKDIPKINPKDHLLYKGLTVYNPQSFLAKHVNIPEGFYTWNGSRWTKTFATPPAGSLKSDLQTLYDLQIHPDNKKIKEWNNWEINLDNPQDTANLTKLNGVFFRKINGEYRIVELRLDDFNYSNITLTKGLEALLHFSVSDNPQLKYLNLKSPNLINFESNNNKWLIKTQLNCPRLTLARVINNKVLTDLDIVNGVQLSNLWIDKNPITTLNTAAIPELTYLTCSNNALTALNLSKNNKLAFLNCYRNALTSLDVSHNSMLKLLLCNENKLTALDVSQNAALQRLACNNNNINELDMQNNSALYELRCFGNAITTLDVSKNPKLELLDCSLNYRLTTLDLSKNLNLKQLYCIQVPLTFLDVSKCRQLEVLKCPNTQLSSLDLSCLSKLKELNCNFSPLQKTPKSVKLSSKAFATLSEAAKFDNRIFFPGESSPAYDIVNCQ